MGRQAILSRSCLKGPFACRCRFGMGGGFVGERPGASRGDCLGKFCGSDFGFAFGADCDRGGADDFALGVFESDGRGGTWFSPHLDLGVFSVGVVGHGVTRFLGGGNRDGFSSGKGEEFIRDDEIELFVQEPGLGFEGDAEELGVGNLELEVCLPLWV